MSTKELLLSKIETMSQAELEELYTVVTEFLQSKRDKPPTSPFLERLGQIHIDGPEDFAENIDLYLNGGCLLPGNGIPRLIQEVR